MKPVRIVMTIFFIILSSLNFHKLLTEGGYRGGKVYVVATTQSVIMQILLIIGLILYLIYLIRAKEHYKPSSNSMLSKKKNKMNLSNRIKALKARLKLQKPEIITNPVQKDELVEQDLCGKDLCDLDHSTIKLLSGDLSVFNDYAFRYYILDFIDFYERFGDEAIIEDMFIQAFAPPMRRALAKQFSRDEVKIIIDFLQKNYENIARITHSKKYKKLKPYEQEEIYIPFKHFEKEIKNAIKFWEKYYKGKIYKDCQMRLIEIDSGKYEEYIYFFIEKNRAYFNAYQEQIFPFDMEYIPSLLWLLTSFAETTIKIFDDLDEKTRNEIFDFAEKGAASEDEYIGTAFCTGFVETIVNIAKEGEYKIISKYFRDETQEYAAVWMKFGE